MDYFTGKALELEDLDDDDEDEYDLDDDEDAFEDEVCPYQPSSRDAIGY